MLPTPSCRIYISRYDSVYSNQYVMLMSDIACDLLMSITVSVSIVTSNSIAYNIV